MVNKTVIDEFEKMFSVNNSPAVSKDSESVKPETDEDENGGYSCTAEQKIFSEPQKFNDLVSDVSNQINDLKDKGMDLKSGSNLAEIAIKAAMKIPAQVSDSEKVKQQLKEKAIGKKDDVEIPFFDTIDSHITYKFSPETDEVVKIVKNVDISSNIAVAEIVPVEILKEPNLVDEPSVDKDVEDIADKNDDESDEETSVEKMFKEPLENIQKHIETNPDKDFSEEISKFERPFFNSDGMMNWDLKSPARMWDTFYARKASFIKYCLPGGQVPFNSYWEELDKYAVVNIASEVFDNRAVLEIMHSIDKLSERVLFIYGRAHRQYVHWDPGVDYLKGRIARIENLKPVSKQDGLVDEHMADIIHYKNSLESLQDYADFVFKKQKNSIAVLSAKLPACYHKDVDKQISVQYAIKEEAQKVESPTEQHPFKFETIQEGIEVQAPEPIVKHKKEEGKKAPTGYVDF